MSTAVVNIRRERPDVYIGRASSAPKLRAMGLDPVKLAGPAPLGYFGNPCAFGQRCPVCGRVHGYEDREGLFRCSKLLFWHRLRTDREFDRRVLALRGLNLGCWCKPAQCHGDLIVAYLDWWSVQRDVTSVIERLVIPVRSAAGRHQARC